MVNDDDTINSVIESLYKTFEDPEFVENFKKYIEEEITKPYIHQLNCCQYGCPYNEPKDADIGTITWCSKYEDTKENENICKDRIYMYIGLDNIDKHIDYPKKK